MINSNSTYDLTNINFTIEYILSKVKKVDSGCWEWIGARDLKGYGVIRRCPNGRNEKPLQIKAHRASWIAFNPVENGISGLCVLHHCDNPSCVNPEHLFIGTKRDNAKDRDAKGRGKLWRGKPGYENFRIGDGACIK